jgi:phosphatidylglycerol:prolipoprotein diacylglycerol transferase
MLGPVISTTRRRPPHVRPTLFTVLGQPVHAYFFLLAVGFTLALLLAARRAAREGLDLEKFLNLEIIVFVAGILGSRVFYVWEDWPYFREHPEDIVRFWRGGLAFYGGFTFATISALAYIAQSGLPLGRIADMAAVYVTLGHVFGKFGCLLHGCCYGKPTGSSWGITFPATAGDMLPRHPAQLYEAAGLIAILVLVHASEASGVVGAHASEASHAASEAPPAPADGARAPRPPGRLFGVYLVSYGMLRFVLELVRDDMPGPTFAGLLRYQWVSLGVAAAGLVVLARTGARRRREGGLRPPSGGGPRP